VLRSNWLNVTKKGNIFKKTLKVYLSGFSSSIAGKIKRADKPDPVIQTTTSQQPETSNQRPETGNKLYLPLKISLS